MTALSIESRSGSESAPNFLPVIGRIAIAAIFLLSGISKITNPAYMIGYIQSAGLPLPQVGLAVAILIEVVGGVALVLGYRTRAVAAVLAAFSLVTAAIFHHNLADQDQFLHFFKDVAIAGGLLNVAAFGGGAVSLDARR